MTDNEIIKALEVHTTSGVWCGECPIKSKKYAMVGSPCVTLLIGEAKDLINRQKAEIERLEERIADLSKTEIFVPARSGGKTHLVWLKLEAFADRAIKEFAERLCEDRVSNDPVVIAIKTELKLMEGETK